MTVLKRERQAAIRRLVATQPVGSQGDLVAALAELGYEVTQATVSRDIAELGLVKVPGGEAGHVLADSPVTIGRSGLILVLVATPGTASVIAQAIDESTLDEQVGTLAGDNTLIVLFEDEPRLLRWLDRFRAIQEPAGTPAIPTEASTR